MVVLDAAQISGFGFSVQFRLHTTVVLRLRSTFYTPIRRRNQQCLVRRPGRPQIHAVPVLCTTAKTFFSISTPVLTKDPFLLPTPVYRFLCSPIIFIPDHL
jgi:hypothetical protein